MGRMVRLADLDFWPRASLLLVAVPVGAFLGSPVWLGFLLGVLAVCVGLNERRTQARILRMTALFAFPMIVAAAILTSVLADQSAASALPAGLTVGLRFIVLIGAGAAFTESTDPWEIPGALAKAGVPHRFCVLVLVGNRLIPLLQRRVRRIVESQVSRGAVLSLAPRNLRRTLRTLHSLIVPVVVSTLSLSVAFADSLISRGFDPEASPPRPEWRWYARDWVVLFFSLILIVCSAFV